jgi:hemolysin activation/secretion protein
LYIFLICICALVCVFPAQAQQVRLPSGAEAGRGQLQPPVPQSTAPSAAIAVPNASTVQAPKNAEKYSFTLTDLSIEGATAFSDSDLKPLYARLIGKAVTVADMFKVANDIELLYRDAGYVTTRVIVPKQTIDDGKFRIKVIEGFVSDIVEADDIGPARAAVGLLIAPLRGIRPINIADIERRLLLANDLPGVTVHGSLEPSPTELGGSVIVIRSERKEFDASLTFDNRNTPYVGGAEWTPTLSWNAFGSRADQLTLTARLSSPLYREWYIAGGYQALLSSGGLTLNLLSAFSRSNPGEELDPLDVRSRVLSEQGTLTYPIIRSRTENLHIFGEFEFRDIATNLLDLPFNRDNLRILRLGLNYDRNDNWDGVTAIRGTIHQGLDILGASQAGSQFLSRADGHANFTKFTAAVTRVQQLPSNFSVMATATAQLSNTALLASEELALGGPSFARAYDDGEISGDKGWAASIELRYSPSWPKFFPGGIQFFIYFDGGQLWSLSKTPLSGGSTLTSGGAGIRANFIENLYATVEMDKPLDHEVLTQKGKPTRAYFSVTARY